ncbi:MAG: hypothetical protein K6E50_12990 [Lachnospiraceae bacterium]|nr:hypothetical protein [Lachnospiraceae bacterium]
MAGISGLGGGVDYSALFGTSNQKSGVDYSSILGLDLSDVASVRNGSYGKLLKNYYAKEKAGAKAVDGDTDAKLTSIKEDADKLGAAADAFQNDKLFETKETKDENGRPKEEFADRDKLAGAVKDFVKAYNAAIDSAGESETKSVLRTGSWMAGMSRQNSNVLKEVGISIGADDKLSFDEEAFKTANTATVKSVFRGVNSYASQVSAKAGSISRATQNTEAIYGRDARWTPQTKSLAEETIARVTGAEEEKSAESEEKQDKVTLSETDADKIRSLQEQRDKLSKEYEKLDSVDKIRDYDKQIAELNRQIAELNGEN